MNFKKITAIATSVLMTGMTVGMAAAANYPAPFVDNGVANVAVVYGTGAGVSSLDMVQAGNIQTSLGSFVKGTTSTVTDGESFDLYKDNNQLNFGDNINSVYTSLDDGDMTALADGDYDSGDIDVEYEQSITLGNTAMSLITDSELNDEEPTIGYHFDDDTVLTYTLSFNDEVLKTDMPKTDLPLFGKQYYVLDATSTKITLLNSAEKTILSEGETVTIDGHDISIEYITSTDVKFNVDGELTDKLADGEYYQLNDDYYIVLSEGLYSDKDGTISKAEISFGSGKVVLENGQEIEVNDDSIDGLTVTLTDGTNSSYLTDIALNWATDGDAFLTEGTSLDMPIFDEFSLFFNGLNFGDHESIVLDNGDTLVLKMGNYDLDLMYNSSTEQFIGGKDHELVTIGNSDGNAVFPIAQDERFLATLLDTDLTDVETVYYEVDSLNNDTAKFDLKLSNLIDTSDDIEAIDQNPGKDYDATDNINIEVIAVYDSGDSVANTTYYNTTISEDYVNHTTLLVQQDFALLNVTSTGTLMWDTVVSEDGMVITLPTTAGAGQTIGFYEANEDGDVDTTPTSASFTLTTAYDSSDKLYATVGTGITMVDETADDKTVGYDAGIHATKVMEDSDVHTLEIEYYADEVTADLQLVAGGVISSGASALGDVLVKDSEVSSVATKNLVIVGGSCINSAAATVLGVSEHTCGEAFTAATGVGAGEFLIKGVEDAYTEGKLALVVAGYDAADTANAATYLTKKDVDTSKEYKGTSETTAEVIVA